MDEILKMKWGDYCDRFNTDTMYFHDKSRDILITVAQGTGDNLGEEDIEEGYVDYWYAEVYSKTNGNCGGGLLLLETYISDDNKTIEETIAYLEENADMFDGISGISLKGTFIRVDQGEDLYAEFEQAAEDYINSVRMAVAD